MLNQLERRDRWIVFISLLGYLAIGFVPYLVSGLIVPPGAVAVLLICWASGLALALSWVERRPLVAPGAVVVAILFWFAFVSVGSALFGWTA